MNESTAALATPIEAHEAALSPLMQSIARNYLAARARAGDAILESARYLAEARQSARYGEWGIFLEATGTQEDTATRMIAIAGRADSDRQYALAVRDGRLAFTAAFELLSAPEATQRAALETTVPTPATTIRKAKQEEKLRTSAEFAPLDRIVPGDLNGWHWISGKRDDYQLTNGDYQTRVYDHPHHAIVGARNYLASQQPDPVPGWICEGCGSRITDMKRPMNPICTQCAIQRQNERVKATPVTDSVPHLPPDFTDAQKRATKIGLVVAMDMNGKFSIKNDHGSGVDQIAEWDSLLRHLAYSEQTAAEIAAERSKEPRAGFVGVTLSEDLQRRLVAVGAAIGSDGTVYAPRGSGESAAILSDSEAEAALVRWADLAQAPARSETERISDGAKRRAIGLLRQLEPLMKLIATGDQEGLIQTMSDLNECEEGTEALHWLRVGYALCDVEADDA